MLLALLYGVGLRRAELVALDLEDFHAEAGRGRVRRGTGHKDRENYVAGGGVEAVRAWLAWRGDVPGPFLWPVRKGGRLETRRTSPHDEDSRW